MAGTSSAAGVANAMRSEVAYLDRLPAILETRPAPTRPNAPEHLAPCCATPVSAEMERLTARACG